MRFSDEAKKLFHGFIAVAPLKRMGVRGRGEPSLLFHGFIAVAPLKPTKPRKEDIPPAPLPRLHRRGPIEAVPAK